MLAAWLLTLVAAPPAFGPGLYRGDISIPTGTVTVALTVRQPLIRGTIEIPQQGLFRYPLSEVVASERSLRFGLPGIPGEPRFALKYRPRQFRGVFSQGSRTYEVTLTKVPAATRVQEAIAGLRTELQEALQIDRCPGLAYGLVQEGHRTAAAFGVHGVEAPKALTADTPFPLGALTRTFTVVAVAQQIELGRWSWSTRIGDVLPGFRLGRPGGGLEVTLRDLVTGTIPFAPHKVAVTGLSSAPPDVILGRIGSLPLQTRPLEDTDWPYVVLGQTLAWPPGSDDGRVAMTEGFLSTFALSAAFELSEDRARRHLRSDKQVIADPFPPSPLRLSRGLWASARTLSLWLQMHIDKALLTAETWALLRDAGAGGWKASYHRGHRVYIAESLDDGTSGVLMLLPEDEVGVVVLANRSDAPVAQLAARHIADRLLGLAPQTDLKAALDASSAPTRSWFEIPRRVPKTRPAHPLKAYAGRFQHPGYGEAVVEVSDKRLSLRLGPLQTELRHWHFETFIPIKTGDPRLPRTPWTFVTDVRGRVVAVDVRLDPRVGDLRFQRTK